MFKKKHSLAEAIQFGFVGINVLLIWETLRAVDERRPAFTITSRSLRHRLTEQTISDFQQTIPTREKEGEGKQHLNVLSTQAKPENVCNILKQFMF